MPMPKREAAPSPQAIHRSIARTVASLGAIEEAYRWLYHQTYGSPGGASEVHTSPHDSNPTMNQALLAARRSRQVRQVAAFLDQVRLVTLDWERTLHGRPEIVERPDQYDMTISADELEQLHEAKGRRTGRGSGWGIG